MKEFKLRGAVPKATILNRPLLLVLAAVVTMLLLWALMVAFEPSAKKNKVQIPTGRSTGSVSPLLKSLPNSYQDVNAIKKYLSDDQMVPQAITEELNKMRAQQATLEAALAKSRANLADDGVGDLFFSGEKPSSALLEDAAKSDRNSLMNGYATAPRTQQDMQLQKGNFVQAVATQGDVYNKFQMIKPVSPHEIQAGTIIQANLLTAINTSLPGDVVAQVRTDIYDTVKGKEILIPKGSKVLGKYDSLVAYGQERILIAFDRIIFPNGNSIQLSNFIGSDDAGSSGFLANTNNHWSKVLGAAVISTSLSFGAGVASDRSSNPNAYYQNAQTGGMSGAAGNISQTGQVLANRAMDIQPTLTVAAGFNFNMIVNKDMVLEPYAGKTL
jgi:type IV secretory pathway VirB10-like protein